MSGAKSANPLHDDDGNLIDYKHLKYSWNAENQLVSAEPKNPADGDKKTEFLYDYMGRRAGKQIYVYSSDGWTKTTEKLFVYDGWNPVKEITKAGASSSDKYYVWGLDLSQSLQGAGGIGGLVCAVHAGEVHHFFYDGNGNVGQVVNESGSIVARYEYDPFGNALVADGIYAQENPFRFSTKYFDAETGLYYYGFRYYSAELGRWWSRDPLGEKGGLNRYAFVANNPNSRYDRLGLDWESLAPAYIPYPESYYAPETEIDSPELAQIIERIVQGGVNAVGLNNPKLPGMGEKFVKGGVNMVAENAAKLPKLVMPTLEKIEAAAKEYYSDPVFRAKLELSANADKLHAVGVQLAGGIMPGAGGGFLEASTVCSSHHNASLPYMVIRAV